MEIYTTRKDGEETAIHCNLSSWYVEPAYRNYAPLLTKIAQRHKHVTYLNISPAVWTWPIIETQGFRAYCRGFIAPPAMQLIYCCCAAEYAACAGRIGRLLLRLGKISVIVDSDEPIPG